MPPVHQEVGRREPDLAAPGARADDLAQAEPLEALGERLAVGGGAFVAQHHHVAAERVLHVPVRVADPVLPVEPGLAEQPAEDPAVDVAAAVVAHVDDQALAIEDGIEAPRSIRRCRRRPWHGGGRSRSCRGRVLDERGASTPSRGSAGRLRRATGVTMTSRDSSAARGADFESGPVGPPVSQQELGIGMREERSRR